MSLVVVPGTVVDGTGGPARRDLAVRVEGADIVEVGPSEAVRRAAPRDAEVVEAPWATLVPGYVDAHVHLAWGLADQPTWPSVAGTPEGRFAWALQGAQAALAAGVTTQRDCGAADLVTVHLRDAIRAGIAVGPRIVACGPCITTTAGHGDFIGVTADSAAEARQRVRELCSAGVDFIKVMASGGDMDPHTNRRHPQYSDEELDALVQDAHRLSLPVVAHCNATASIRQAVASGVETIAHCNWLGAEEGTIEYDPAVAAAMIEQGTVIDLNVEATIRPYADGDGWAMPPEHPANRWELHQDLRAAGARLLFSSDQFGARTATFPALLARAVQDLGLDVTEVVHRATAVPAAAVGAEDGGVVAVGRRADLVLLDGDATADAGVLARARTVWLDGQRVVDAGRIQIPEGDR